MLGNRFGDLGFDGKDVGQLAIVGVSPDVRIVLRVDQLHIHPHLFADFLDTAFQ